MLLLFLANNHEPPDHQRLPERTKIRCGRDGGGRGGPVAVKVIRPDRTDPHTRARFEREATIARTAAVSAPALPGLTDRFRMS
ncbi:hypothetical protein [Streptomyces ossamyceticus]|uniref:hypothetical protein n=1 Tax=Streptomyces ossamyceticus TaxID=249581 RepID=UPI000A8B858E|nr:hypothetical protein [Streptomyces ossamyceticus]